VLEEPDAEPPLAGALDPPAEGCPAPDAPVLPELAVLGDVMPAAARAWAWPEAKAGDGPWDWVWP
jgi:hypothetical protein